MPRAGSAAAQGRAEALRQSHQAQHVHIHGVARGVHVLAPQQAAFTFQIGRVHQDLDLAADGGGHAFDGIRVGNVHHDGLHARVGGQGVEGVVALPGLRIAQEHGGAARIQQGVRHGLAHRGLAVRDQGPAELRVARGLAKGLVVFHVRGVPFWQGDHHGLAAAIQLQRQPHAGAVGAILVHVGHDRGAGVHAHGAHAPRQAFAEIEVVAVVQGGADQQHAVGVGRTPGQVRGQAVAADFAGRVLHRAAVGAGLQVETALGGGRGQPQCAAAAPAGRQRGLAGTRNRVLPGRFG
ncbi:hypothetical protein G6F35_009615 [Rhizopus arrhizus]|nr:hypothetical protein G6F35_009615 [Rhizopus arrhizus]